MTQNEFIKYYSIADAEPVDPSKKAIPAESFSSAIEEFVNQRFPAAVRVKCGNVTAQSILVCCEYVAYFFKTLITDIYGRVMLNIEIHSDGKGLYVDIHTDGELPLTDKELRQLIRLARNGGFEFYPRGKWHQAVHRLYSHGSKTCLRSLYCRRQTHYGRKDGGDLLLRRAS